MGNWSWMCQACRAAFAIPHAVFAFIYKYRGLGPKPLWDVVRAELWSCGRGWRDVGAGGGGGAGDQDKGGQSGVEVYKQFIGMAHQFSDRVEALEERLPHL